MKLVTSLNNLNYPAGQRRRHLRRALLLRLRRLRRHIRSLRPLRRRLHLPLLRRAGQPPRPRQPGTEWSVRSLLNHDMDGFFN